jgi:hypothetical protein
VCLFMGPRIPVQQSSKRRQIQDTIAISGSLPESFDDSLSCDRYGVESRSSHAASRPQRMTVGYTPATTSQNRADG